MERIGFQEAARRFPPVDEAAVDEQLQRSLRRFDRKIVVLDDDPTGVQTVHGISVYTDWSAASMAAGFAEKKPLFFVLTNSRGLTAEATASVHREIALNILAAATKANKQFIIISRSDSTLRGHYPLETAVLRQTLEANSPSRYHGEIILPFFKEGGRFTVDGVHYVQEGDWLIPAGDSEFAADKTFGYTQSHLGKWIEEKTRGEFKAANVEHITPEDLRLNGADSIAGKLLKMDGFNKVVVDAFDYVDVKLFTIALLAAMAAGRNFLFRTAAALPKVIGGIADRQLLTGKELLPVDSGRGGLIIVGSHVRKTSEQLAELLKSGLVRPVEFNQHLVLDEGALVREVERVIAACEQQIAAGRTVAVYTRRDRLDVGGGKEAELRVAVKIADAVTSIVAKLAVRPAYIIAKGGITSSEIGVKGLRVSKALVAGQIRPGVPVWITGGESKFPALPYIIFPGNVGTPATLREVVATLNRR